MQINRFFLGLFWAIVGLAVSTIVYSRGIDFDATVGLADIIEVAVTIGVLFYLQNLLTKRDTVERIEKDLLIERLRWIVQKLLYFREFSQREILSPSELSIRQSITSDIRAVEAALLEATTMMEATPLKVDKEAFKNLTRGILKIRASLTGGSFPAKPLDEKTNRLVGLQIGARLRDLHAFIVHVNRLE